MLLLGLLLLESLLWLVVKDLASYYNSFYTIDGALLCFKLKEPVPTTGYK
jgi:hypothetical protein